MRSFTGLLRGVYSDSTLDHILYISESFLTFLFSLYKLANLSRL